ncbi:10756_t:CDS:2 [Entrophospora sp. SA101]|nr:10756_t:CDS:2 [Entrophospora sp. SA101]
MAQKKIRIISFFFVWCIIINYVNAADLSVVVAGSEAFYKFTPATLSAFLGDKIVFKKYAATKTPLIRLVESDSKDACIRTKRADAFFGELLDTTTTATFAPAKAGTYYIFDLLNTDCSSYYNNWFTLTVDNAPANAPKAPAQPTTQSISQPPAQPTSQPPAQPTSQPPAPPTSKSAASSTSESPAAKSSSTSSVSQPPGTNSSTSTSQSSAASTQSSSSVDSPKPLSTEIIVGIVGSVTGGIFAVIAALITVKYLSVVVSDTFYKFSPAALTAILGDNVIFKRSATVKSPLIRLAESDSKDACLRTKRADAFYGELPDATTTVTFTPAKVGTNYIFDLLNTDCSPYYNNWFTLTVEDAPKVNATQSTGLPKVGSGAILGAIAIILGIIAFIVKAKYSRNRENFYIYNEQNNTLNEQNFNQQNNSSVQQQNYEQNYNQQNYNQQNYNQQKSLQQSYEHNNIQAPAPPYNEQGYNNNAVAHYNANYEKRI